MAQAQNEPVTRHEQGIRQGPMERPNLDAQSSREIRDEIDRTRYDMDLTVRELRDRLSGENMANRFYGSARELISDPSVIVDHIQRNPLPTAVTLVGLGWLFFRSTEHEDLDRWAGEKKASMGRSLRRSAHRLRERGSDMAHDASESIRHKKDQLMSKGHEKYEGFTEQAGEKGADYSERISEWGHDVGERAGRQAHHAQVRLRGTARSTGDRFSQLFQDNPLGIGALAFALGSAIALTLPRTRTEDELMGESRDQLLEEARRRGEQAIDKTKEVTGAAVEAAKEAGEKGAAELRKGIDETSREFKPSTGGEIKSSPKDPLYTEEPPEFKRRTEGPPPGQFHFPEEGGGEYKYTRPE